LLPAKGNAPSRNTPRPVHQRQTTRSSPYRTFLLSQKGGFSFSFAAAIFVKHAYFAVAPTQIRRACDQKRQPHPLIPFNKNDCTHNQARIAGASS
jgi:hypothetical protein